MNVDVRPTIEDEAYEALVQSLISQGYPPPGRDVRSREPAEVAQWVDELNEILPIFHQLHSTAQLLSSMRSSIMRVVKQDEEKVRRLLCVSFLFRERERENE